LNWDVFFKSNQPQLSKSKQVPLEKPSSQQEKQIAKINKLRDIGLTDFETAQLLEISLELITDTSLEELA
jgi:hypothetical protein